MRSCGRKPDQILSKAKKGENQIPILPSKTYDIRVSQDAAKDREAFLMAQLFFWLIAAPDGHAKNFSVFIERGGRFRLTPLYDIMSAYPALGRGPGQLPPEKLKLAMAFFGKNRHYEWSTIGPRHLRQTARRCGMGEAIDEVIGRLVAGIPKAVAELSAALPQGFPGKFAGPIFKGIEERTKLLEAARSTGNR